MDDWSPRGGFQNSLGVPQPLKNGMTACDQSFSWNWVDETYASVVPGVLLQNIMFSI